MMPPDLSRIACGKAPPERAALITYTDHWETLRITYGALEERIAAAAALLQEHGVSPGQTVALKTTTSAEGMLANLAIMRAGGVLVPINHKLPMKQQIEIVQQAECSHLIVDSNLANDTVQDVNQISLGTLLDASLTAATAKGHSDRAMIMFTSGSSGTPKGVPLTHSGYLWAMERFEMLRPVIEGESTVIAAPMFHMNGQFHTLSVLMLGGTAVLLPKFSPELFLNAARHYSSSRLTGVPTMFELCARMLEGSNGDRVPGVRSIGMGSAPVSQSLLTRLQSVFPNAAISNGYGTTEIGPATFGPHPDDIPTPELSIGYPMRGVETMLIGPSLGEGELLIKTGMQTEGYLGRDDLTTAAFEDGWYKTGDLMRRDTEGFFYFVGRVDDMFVSGGENIHPAAVERTLLEHPSVHEAAVVALDDPVKGAIPVAFVVGEIDPQSMKAHALENGPAYAHPRFVEVLETLPLAGTNKVDRKALSARAAEKFGGIRR